MAAAQKSRIHEGGRAVWIQLRHKDIVTSYSAMVRRIESAGCSWKIGRHGVAGHIGVAGSIDGDAISNVVTAAAQKRRIDHRRIDNQWLTGIVTTDSEPDMVLFRQDVATINLAALTFNFLIDDRLRLAKFASDHVEYQAAVRIERQAISSRKAHPDRLYLGARLDHKVVFQLALVTVVNDVNTGVNAFVVHARIRGHIRSPLAGVIAEKVVHFAGQLILSQNFRVRSCSNE